MRIAVIDTYYESFLRSFPLAGGTYQQELDRILGRRFGTYDCFSRGLRDQGHEAIDILANHDALQQAWSREAAFSGQGIQVVKGQIAQFEPDCVFLQDLSLFSVAELDTLGKRYILAGQCSCRFDDDEKLKRFDVLFSSFPFHVERFNALGVQGVFLPLAFDPIILEHSEVPVSRTHVSFVGGYGRHWEMDKLFTVLAERTPIQFWGYGFDKAPKVVRDRWQSEAWGVEMYSIYMRSHLVLNRHGGISRGLTNNLRTFEAPGCGAMLLTEDSPNIRDYFAADECVTYRSPEEAAHWINYYLAHPAEMLRIASAGQRRTISQHSYAQRMPLVSKALQSLKVAA